MSMLAEKKRKQKWILNPRGNDWSKDPSKFGQKLLEKMGWSPGKGLGAEENGMKEHIRVAYKNDSKGMGFKDTDGVWTEHEKNFTALLETLSSANGIETQRTSDSPIVSLEEKSKNSKARVHYRKFTRGKDLSRYSQKDLANIFGKKSFNDVKENKREINKAANETEDIEKKSDSYNFSIGGSMTDYFKKKISGFGKSAKFSIKHNNEISKIESDNEEQPAFGFGFENEKTYNNGIDFNNIASKVEENRELSIEISKEKKTKTSTRTSEDVINNDEVSTTKSKKEEIHADTPIKENGTSNRGISLLVNPTEVQNHILEPIEELAHGANDEHSTPRNKEAEEQKKKIKKNRKRKYLEISDANQHFDKIKTNDVASCIVNPAFNPLWSSSSIKMKKHVLEPIKENIHEDEIDSMPVFQNPKVEKPEKSETENDMPKTLIIHEDIKIDHSKIKFLKTKTKKRKSKICGTKEIENDPSFTPIEKHKSKMSGLDNPCLNIDISTETIIDELESNLSQLITDNQKKMLKKSKRKIKEVENHKEQTILGKEKKKAKKSKKELGLDNPLFNNNIENASVINETKSNLFEMIMKDSKKKKKNNNEISLENPIFNNNVNNNVDEVNINNEYEVKRKDKSKKKNQKEQIIGLDNPGLNLDDTVHEEDEEHFDIQLNVVDSAPVTNADEENMRIDPKFSIKRVTEIKRKKSVKFSDVTQEIIIANDDEEMDIKSLSTSSKMGKKFANNKNGLTNLGFDEQANNIEENVNMISHTLESLQAEVENDINEMKIKSIELDDLMVGEVGNPDGTNEKLSDGSVKMKFKYAGFSDLPMPAYMEQFTGPKKSYKHLIRGDIVLKFTETNLHEIPGYATNRLKV